MPNVFRFYRIPLASGILAALLSSQCVNPSAPDTAAATINDTEGEATGTNPAMLDSAIAGGTASTRLNPSPSASSAGGPGETLLVLDGAVPEKPLCDGSQSLRLTLTRLPPHVGGVGGRLISFPFEVGLNSIWVGGDCRFWIQEAHATSVTQTLRTGTLTEELETELAADMHYSQLNQFDDHYGTENDLGGYFVVSDGVKGVWCRGYCTETPTAPTQLVEMEARYQVWSDRLQAMSENVTGRMWAILTKGSDASPPDTDCDLSWPFSFDPSPLAQPVTSATSEFESQLLDEAASRELRQWWHDNIENPNPCFPNASGGNFLVQEPDQTWTLYTLLMRDSMPLEDPDGTVSLPVPERL